MNRFTLRTALLTATCLAGLLIAPWLKAQEPGNVPETKAPVAPQVVTPAAPTAPPAEQIAAWQKTHEEQMKNDWP